VELEDVSEVFRLIDFPEIERRRLNPYVVEQIMSGSERVAGNDTCKEQYQASSKRRLC
jgi:hypothetical protein